MEPCVRRAGKESDGYGGRPMSSRLLVVGYANMDVLALVDRLPQSGGRVTAGSIVRVPGGMAANVACAAARLGAAVRFFGVIGQDPDGDRVIDDFEKFGVQTDSIVRTNRPTTTAVVLVEPDGERTIISEPAVAVWEPLREAVGTASCAQQSCVYVDGHHLLDALPILQLARERGMTVAADLDGLQPPELLDNAIELGTVLDLAFLNRRSAASVRADATGAARWLLGLGVRGVAVTLGCDGALVCDADSVTAIAAPPVHPKDTTGAGDVFAAGFMVTWEGEQSTQAAGQVAVAASALSVEGYGARGCLPTWQEVGQALSSRGERSPSG